MDYYLIGLGSNLQPEENMIAVHQALSGLASDLQVRESSQILINPPCGTSFHFPFHNQLVVIQSSLSWDKLKTLFESIEVRLGREQKNPQRQFKDRTIDIDILKHSTCLQDLFKQPLEESYNQKILANWPLALELSSQLNSY